MKLLKWLLIAADGSPAPAGQPQSGQIQAQPAKPEDKLKEKLKKLV